jgi:hypothetical protein
MEKTAVVFHVDLEQSRVANRATLNEVFNAGIRATTLKSALNSGVRAAEAASW